jgi:hypothetical protein
LGIAAFWSTETLGSNDLEAFVQQGKRADFSSHHEDWQRFHVFPVFHLIIFVFISYLEFLFEFCYFGVYHVYDFNDWAILATTSSLQSTIYIYVCGKERGLWCLRPSGFVSGAVEE